MYLNYVTRMHSSRMRTARSGSCRGGPGQFPLNFPLWVWAWPVPPQLPPLGVGMDQIPLNFPLGCGHGPDPPQFAPWLWAWTRSHSISPMVVGLDQIPLNFPLGCGPGDPSPGPGTPPPVNRITDTCKNITLPQTSFAGGN